MCKMSVEQLQDSVARLKRHTRSNPNDRKAQQDLAVLERKLDKKLKKV